MALILDTGPLYASIDRRDAAHDACRQLIINTSEPLVIPAPVLVEVDYLSDRHLHPDAFVSLLDDITRDTFVVEELQPEDYRRIREICDRYSDSRVGSSMLLSSP